MDNPKIAISVYVENAGFGADLAAPLAQLMIEQYLTGKLSAHSERKARQWYDLMVIPHDPAETTEWEEPTEIPAEIEPASLQTPLKDNSRRPSTTPLGNEKKL